MLLSSPSLGGGLRCDLRQDDANAAEIAVEA